jgi:mono/diheme cytochrome c family protein/glucose/arabinose dehydrogenase
MIQSRDVPPEKGAALARRLVLSALVLAVCAASLPAQTDTAKRQKRVAPPTNWGTWVEPDFPFFSTVLHAPHPEAGSSVKNLTPRALVMNLGRECWVAFDTDLLRVAAIWRGKGVTPRALAPGSYIDVTWKTPGGQFPAPEPDGNVWLVNGIHPGWQTGAQLSLRDPREPAPSPEEVGRGPLSEEAGRLKAVRLVRGGAVLEYTAGGALVHEWMTLSEHAGQPVIERHFRLEPSSQPRLLAIGHKSHGAAVSLGGRGVELADQNGVWTVRVPAHREAISFAVAMASGGTAPAVAPRAIPTEIAAPRWPQEVTTTVKRSTAKEAYVVDHVGLPAENPWRRAVRVSDIQFLKDGTGVTVTHDGDVWLIRGMHDPAGKVRWRRFASGLHEPMSIAIRDNEIFAFDKNGIWRLRDTSGNGEADVHELFSNAFAQTADMREFAATIRLGPGGEFVIAKGGQQATTLGKHNGSVLRVSADGRRSTVLGHGFRQPSIGVNPRTGLVTSSDQQGQYIPSTPLHIVRDNQFYGYLASFQPREQYPAPIAEPLTWFPHAVNASATSQIWLHGARMGPLNDGMVHVGFNRPEIFRVLFNERGSRLQASVVSITKAFEFPLLNGSVNPADGQLYIAGFQILGWGNILDSLAGIGRVRYTGAPVLIPHEITPTDKGVLLRFDVELDPKKATDPSSYTLQSWHYQRTFKYGSPQYKEDGTPGQDWLPASSAYLSQDRRSVFVGVPNMKPVMQIRIGWSLATAAGAAFEDNGYTTPYELAKFNPKAEGFGDIQVDLTSRGAVIAAAATPVTVEEGKRLAQLFACIACHATEDGGIARAGPSWKGLYDTERTVFVGGKPVKARIDHAYLRESIYEPTAKVAAGFEKGDYAMPSYAGVLSEEQVEALILYIKTLR